jgi:transcription elongation factor S-II
VERCDDATKYFLNCVLMIFTFDLERKLELEDVKEESNKSVKDEESKSPALIKEEHKEETSILSSSPKPVNGSSTVKEYFIGDATRDKCLEMLVNALMTDQSDSQSPDELIINTAQGIERSLFNEFKGVTANYKSKFRSKYLNLKDKNNPTLRSGLISGMITPERFTSMTSAEMASDERRRINSMIAEQNMLNSQMAKDNAAETDQFKCGRCNQRKCKYYQMQTRSADEPMTTFVTCVNCGNRWRVRIFIHLFI